MCNTLNRHPAFVLSLDTELVWGSFDHTPPSEWALKYGETRVAIADILELLDEFAIPATWAVVGHLFLSSCARNSEGLAHPELKRPRFSWYPHDWLALDPCTDRSHESWWYGDDIVDAILKARVRHEIGCHSFSHIVFGDPACSGECIEADLGECLKVAAQRSVRLRSFVFPRNIEGHHDLLLPAGFCCFRGAEPSWYSRLPSVLRRAGHYVDQALAIPPPVSTPCELQPGLWNIPASALLLHRGGIRRLIPLSSRITKARRGLEQAVKTGKVFHLWFHPFNLCPDRREMTEVLRKILSIAADLRDKGLLQIMTMASLADQMTKLRDATSDSIL
jgi:hypothetical protein